MSAVVATDSPATSPSGSSENEHGHRKFTFLEAMAFGINVAMGTGFLTCPWAFQKSGIILGLVAMICLASTCCLSALFVLETCARCEALERHREATEHIGETQTIKEQESAGIVVTPNPKTETVRRRSISGSKPSVEMTTVKKLQSCKSMDVECEVGRPHYEIEERKFEMSDMSMILMGPIGFFMFGILYVISAWGVLFSSAQVFALPLATALSKSISGQYCKQAPEFTFGAHCWDSYAIAVAAFSAVVIPLSCMRLKEQVMLQVAMTFLRIILVFVMLATTIFNPSGSMFENVASSAIDTFPKGSFQYFVNFSGFGTMVPIIAYSLLLHDCIPSITKEIGDKKKAGTIFIVCISILATFYTLVAMVLSVYFQGLGKDVPEAIQLNWSEYGGDNAPWWALAIRYFILFGPSIDIVSAFPITAIVCANNITSVYHIAPKLCGNDGKPLRCDVDLNDLKLLPRISFCLSACVPPLIGALFVSSVGAVLDVTGLFGFFLLLIFPALWAFLSRWKCTEIWNSFSSSSEKKWNETPYNIRLPGLKHSDSALVQQILIFVLGIALLALGTVLVAKEFVDGTHS